MLQPSDEWEAPWLEYGDAWFGRSYIGQPPNCFDLPAKDLIATFYDVTGGKEHYNTEEMVHFAEERRVVAPRPFDMTSVVRNAMRFTSTPRVRSGSPHVCPRAK